MTGARKRPITGRHVLAILVGFFAVVIAANGVMAWLAIDSFPGLVSADPYREGLAWNRTLAERKVQAALGWQVTVDVSGSGATQAVTARFRDRSGVPLSGLAVNARLVRTVAQGEDRSARLEETSPGLYRAGVNLPLAGKWRLELDARQRDGTRWRMERELWRK
jgi:nitrogen fixation protein FixH